MDSLDSAAILEYLAFATSHVDSQFEYWLTITFAAIVAGAVAGPRLDRKVRLFLVVLYLLATTLLTLEYLGAAQQVVQLVSILADRGMTQSGVNFGPYQFVVRWLLFLAGTIGTCWFLLTQRNVLADKGNGA